MEELFSKPEEGPAWDELRNLMTQLQEQVDTEGARGSARMYLLQNLRISVDHLQQRMEDLTELVQALVNAYKAERPQGDV